MKKTTVKFLLTVFAFMLTLMGAQAQDRHLTRSGSVKFFSSAPMEDIEAVTNKALSIIDIKKSTVAVDILMKSFSFDKKLMQEHFNENYMESDKFPKGSFKGAYVADSNISNLVDGTYEVLAKGELSIHGVKKQIETPVTLNIKGRKISANFVFKVNVAEFDIKIPKVVVKNIAEEVEVTCAFEYEPYN